MFGELFDDSRVIQAKNALYPHHLRWRKKTAITQTLFTEQDYHERKPHTMKIMRKIIEIDETLCDGCGLCVPACAEGAIAIIDRKARLVSERYCDGLGACLGNCPTGALKVIERQAEDFDEEAVKEHLKRRDDVKETAPSTPPRTCPSARIMDLDRPTPCQEANRPVSQRPRASLLSNWPLQIRLVPPDAPFLKDANLLIAADCTAVAYPDFHNQFVRSRIVLLGCPKFDDQSAYIEKFAAIFRAADIKKITCLIMEVPCCATMMVLIDKAMEMAGRSVPVENIIISPKGDIVKR